MQGTIQALDRRLRQDGYLPDSSSTAAAAQDAGIWERISCPGWPKPVPGVCADGRGTARRDPLAA